MSAAVITSYALASAGLAVMAWGMFSVFKLRINVTVGNQQLIKLAKAGNLERARKLCSAAPGTYFDAVKVALLAIPPGSKDRVTIAAAMEGPFAEVGKQLERKVAKKVEIGFLGAILVAGGFGLAMSGSGAGTTLVVFAGLAALCAVWLVGNRSHMTNSLERARQDVLPVIAEAAETSTALPQAD